ncbi:MAG: hypothetical protein K0S56_554 [Microvirga sp.]|jgi:hypothetical protein|nr:hypothetical protein [Microvirga sp.]
MSSPQHEPAECFVCQRRATGLGIGDVKNPRWLCVECSLIAEQIRSTKRLDMYEVSAIGDAMNAVGTYLEEIGKTDLGDFEDIEARTLVKRAVLEFGNSIRRQIREHKAPF